MVAKVAFIPLQKVRIDTFEVWLDVMKFVSEGCLFLKNCIYVTIHLDLQGALAFECFIELGKLLQMLALSCVRSCCMCSYSA